MRVTPSATFPQKRAEVAAAENCRFARSKAAHALVAGVRSTTSVVS
jgi:hypothetical protein